MKKGKKAIFCDRSYGPCFSGTSDFNIYICGDHFLTIENHTSSSKDNDYEINSDYELNNSKRFFYIRKLEIFQIIFD